MLVHEHLQGRFLFRRIVQADGDEPERSSAIHSVHGHEFRQFRKLESIDEESVAKLARNDTKKLLVVNVWATWCGPCVAELPEFVTMNRSIAGRPFRLVTISLDDPAKKEAALKVLMDKHVACTNYVAAFKERDKFADRLTRVGRAPAVHPGIAPGARCCTARRGPSTRWR